MSTTPEANLDAADEILESIGRQNRRFTNIMLTILSVLVIGLLVVVLILLYNSQHETSRINNAVNTRTQTLCDFVGSIGPLPLDAKATKTGVGVIAGARNAFIGLNCPGRLPPPSAMLINLTNKYHVHLVG